MKESPSMPGEPLTEALSAGTFLDEYGPELGLTLIAGAAGRSRLIRSFRVCKAGLALVQRIEPHEAGRVQILGAPEMHYLASLDDGERTIAGERLSRVEPAAVVVTANRGLPTGMAAWFDRQRLPLWSTPSSSQGFIEAAGRILEARLAPKTLVHGSLVDVTGMGILIRGKSGVGKSETALSLVRRGHRLVADDTVLIHREQGGLIGESPQDIRYYIEVRGLGIINVKDLFGASSVRRTKRIEIVVNLVRMDKESVQADRSGLEERTYELLGVSLPFLEIPVRPGKDLGMLLEVAARNELLKFQGVHSARDFQARLLNRLAASTAGEGAEGDA